MRQFAHFASMAIAVVLMVALVGNLATAGPAATAINASDAQYDKVPVCHATGSAKNPYVFLKVPRESAHFGMHQDDLVGPTIASKDDCPDTKSKSKNDSTAKANAKHDNKAKKGNAKGKSKKANAKGKGHAK
jgi:hypothetical protein